MSRPTPPLTPPATRTTRRSSSLLRLSLAGLATAAAIGLGGSAALAQPGQSGSNELRPPIPMPPTRPPSHPISTAVAIALLIMIVGANTIPSKRGHQD